MRRKAKGGVSNEFNFKEAGEMKKQRPFKGKIALFVVAVIMAAAGSTAWASENGGGAEPLALQMIMQEMGRNMQIVTDAISREDWELVAKAAPLIADHPQPPLAEKLRILSFAGTDAGRFKSLDGQTHQAAMELKEAAVEEDGIGAIAKFAALQTGCLACHQSFRKTFREHFYGQQ